MRVLEMYRYPVKSFAGQSLDQASLHGLGIHGDRRFMLIDASGRFVSAREQPALLRWQAIWEQPEQLVLIAPDGTRHAPGRQGSEVLVTVWDDQFPAELCDAATHAWLSERLGFAVRMVFVPDPSPRGVDPRYAPAGTGVGFADGYPVLVLTDASLRQLQQTAGETLSIRRFRPNLVISADTPHAEDGWRRLQIGDCELQLVKPCVRCVLTTLDPDTGSAHAEREPLRSLIGYRRGPKGVTFGMNALVTKPGVIRLDDRVTLIE